MFRCRGEQLKKLNKNLVNKSREVSRNLRKGFRAPSSPFAAGQPLCGGNLDDPQPHVFMDGSTVGSRLPCLHGSAQAESEGAFPAFMASTWAGSEAAFPAFVGTAPKDHHGPSVLP